MPISYPLLSSDLAFAAYLANCRALIAERRIDLLEPGANKERIIETNSPFELPSKKKQYGALLIHGLFDCPFSLKDIAEQLHTQDIFCRAILLPGHGTRPEDLLTISYEDWIAAVRYGIESLSQEVEQIFLIGYSTGAALSIYHALQDARIKGLVLLAPAIKIKAPVDTIFNWHSLIKWATKNHHWISREKEIDYAKYLSIAFNPVSQVNKLTTLVNQLQKQTPLQCKIMMITSFEDETISSKTAIKFFSSLHNQDNRLLLYMGTHHHYGDARILSRLAHFSELNVKHFSHVSIPFSPDNFHYGQYGDYLYASHMTAEKWQYGAYNRLEENTYEFLYQYGLIQTRRRQLTYNPDFHFMAEKIVDFILQST